MIKVYKKFIGTLKNVPLKVLAKFKEGRVDPLVMGIILKKQEIQHAHAKIKQEIYYF